MEKFTTITSKVIPLPLKDVDTDLIIPAQFMTSISREGYGQNLFKRLRDKDPQFPFNQEKYKDAQILAVDDNFGCGSSREHAVWAICGAGIRVILGKSFADIFFSNAAKNGLLLVTLPAKVVDGVLAAAKIEEYTITVDLENQFVSLPKGERVGFEYEAFRKHCLLNGLDDIDYIRTFENDIERFRSKQEKEWAFSTLGTNDP
jgi:3-isopropylmalate/(R)-2-methylmalate dehydratase small subunit